MGICEEELSLQHKKVMSSIYWTNSAFFKRFTRYLGWHIFNQKPWTYDELFSIIQHLSHRRNVRSLSLFYRYLHGDCSDETRSLISPFLTFTVKTHRATYVLSKDISSLQNPFVMFKFDQIFPTSPLLCGTNSQEVASTLTTLLACSSVGLTVIFTTYLINCALAL